MSTLTSKQRRWLRGRAHDLKPVVQLGTKGLTEPVVEAVDQALETHELIKVRLVGEREEREVMAEEISDRVEAHLVGVTGRVAILFRPQPESENPLRLPEG
ncbi:MAG TPA: ribosome assembly RNA-binding protein YhbY [Thermoanaerobaculia bacterium]|nr:ribosome assembly RNA-binding protein YhbY [Thermoanaerobaculia bacterium]